MSTWFWGIRETLWLVLVCPKMYMNLISCRSAIILLNRVSYKERIEDTCLLNFIRVLKFEKERVVPFEKK